MTRTIINKNCQCLHIDLYNLIYDGWAVIKSPKKTCLGFWKSTLKKKL